MALVLEAHRDPVAVERPEVLAQRVVELALPLAREELDDLGAAVDELVAVAPQRVLGVGARDPLRVAGVPGVLGRLDLLAGGLLGERRERGSHQPIVTAASAAPIAGASAPRPAGSTGSSRAAGRRLRAQRRLDSRPVAVVEPEAAADDHGAGVERVDERREREAEPLRGVLDHVRRRRGRRAPPRRVAWPVRRASASPLDQRSTSGAPVPIALPRTPDARRRRRSSGSG